MEKKLKPVTFTTGRYLNSEEGDLKQRLLLKALKVTNDPKELRDMIGAKTVADVYRTFDKLALRKEYHTALAKLNIDFSYIAKGIKKIADDDNAKDADRLNAFKTFLKSLGLEDYKDAPPPSDGWEELLTKMSQKEKSSEDKVEEAEVYEVEFPKIPDKVKQSRDEEDSVGKSLYE